MQDLINSDEPRRITIFHVFRNFRHLNPQKVQLDFHIEPNNDQNFHPVIQILINGLLHL